MEVKFIDISGYYGGDQHWLPTFFMRRGGCSTVTAAETCAYLAAANPSLRALYPGDPEKISREDFISFAAQMFKFVYPRIGGLTKLSLYTGGIDEYAKSVGANICFDTLDGTAPYEAAESFLKNAIDSGYCVPCLLLDHADSTLYDLIWHWFTLTGYEYQGGEMQAVFANLGKRCTVPFRHMWNTRRSPKGGLVVVKPG